MKPFLSLPASPPYRPVLLAMATNGFADKSKEELEERIRANLARLAERQRDGKWAIPPQVLAQAKGIVILHSVKAGSSSEPRSGMASPSSAMRTALGAPAFVALVNRSFGFQAGADEAVTILCLMTEQSLKVIHHGANVEVESTSSRRRSPRGGRRAHLPLPFRSPSSSTPSKKASSPGPRSRPSPHRRQEKETKLSTARRWRRSSSPAKPSPPRPACSSSRRSTPSRDRPRRGERGAVSGEQ